MKKEIKTAVYVQYAGKEAEVEKLVAAAKKAYVAAGHKETDKMCIRDRRLLGAGRQRAL